MLAFKAALPADDPVLKLDLTQLVRVRLDEEIPECGADSLVQLLRWRLMRFAMAGTAVGALLLVTLWQVAQPAPLGPETRLPQDGAYQTPVQEALGALHEAKAREDLEAAYVTLKARIASHPSDPYTPGALVALADTAFAELAAYEEAAEHYAAYARSYTPDYLMHPEQERIAQIRNLLAEARVDDFAALHTLARLDGPDSFDELEEVIAKYPCGFIAGEAARKMAAIASGDADRAGVDALVAARDRTEHPAARAQLNLEIAAAYAASDGGAAQARSLLEEVATNGGGVFAQVASARLSALSD